MLDSQTKGRQIGIFARHVSRFSIAAQKTHFDDFSVIRKTEAYLVEKSASVYWVIDADAGGQRIRVLEITPDLVHPEWCEKGHAGFVLEGELELRFENQVVQYGMGDGFVNPSGSTDKHIPRALSSRTVLLLFEEDNSAVNS